MEVTIKLFENKPHIFVDSSRVIFTKGMRAILQYKQWTREDMAHYTRMSVRTVDGWMTGRKPSNGTLVALSYMLK